MNARQPHLCQRVIDRNLRANFCRAVMLLALLGLGCNPSRTINTSSGLSESTRGEIASVGLESIRWYAPIDGATRRDGIARAISEGIATRVNCDLDSQGMTLLRVDSSRLTELLNALGGSPTARRLVLGQTTAWNDLASVMMERGTPMLVAGRPQNSEQLMYRLSVRGWCFPTVDAAAARVELRISTDATRITAITTDPSQVHERGHAIRNGRATMELARNEALLLLETPVVAAKDTTGDGPEALPPPTLAARLLVGTPFYDRVLLLVIVPSFADILPPTLAVSNENAGVVATPSKPEKPLE